MKELLSCFARKSLLLLSMFSCALSLYSDEKWPFPDKNMKVSSSEDGQSVSIYNGLTGISVDKKGAFVKGIWSAENGKSAGGENTKKAPFIWSAEILRNGEKKTVEINPSLAEKTECLIQGDEKFKKVILRYSGIHSGNSLINAECVFSLSANEPFVRWRGSIGISGTDSKLWSFTCPSVFIIAQDKEKTNEVVYPYRRGRKECFGSGAPRYDAFQPYPGPAAKFQFMAAYGKNSCKGFYFAAEDADGYSKTFRQKNRPEHDGMIFAMEHFPDGMGLDAVSYNMSYDVVTGPFTGTWWDAARIYRAWWIKQIWASKGLISDRKDVPEWLKKSPISVRFSTTQKSRTVPNNLASAEKLIEFVNKKPFFGVWYGPFERGVDTGEGLGDSGSGHILPLKKGVSEVLTKLKSENVYLQAYIQSIIYSAKSDLSPQERPEAEAAVTRDIEGNICFYGNGKNNSEFAMCRASEWWQQRLVDLSVDAVKKGFTGVYLDSFGKGAADCYASNHKHSRGGGNTKIAGQRIAAEKIRRAIRAINPDAIMSGEDPGEAFRDLLDVNLSSANVYQNYLPVYRSVWGDYELLYGRSIAPVGDGGNLVPELSRLFIDGMIIGRFFCESGSFFMDRPEFSSQKKFLEKLINYSQAGIDYLRFGEYLNPNIISSKIPEMIIGESTQKNKISVPSVLNAVLKSHRDGSIAYVFVNTGTEAQTVDFTIDPGLLSHDKKADLFTMDEKGSLNFSKKLSGTSSEKMEILPGNILFLVIKN